MDNPILVLIICGVLMIPLVGFFIWVASKTKSFQHDNKNAQFSSINLLLSANGMQPLTGSVSATKVAETLNELRNKLWYQYVDKQDAIIEAHKITFDDGSGMPTMLETSTALGLCATNKSQLVFIPCPVCDIPEKGKLKFSFDIFTSDILYVHTSNQGYYYFTFKGHKYNYTLMDLKIIFDTCLKGLDASKVQALELDKIQCWDIEGNITEKTTYPSIMGKAATGYIFGGLAGAAVGAALAPAQVEKEDRRRLVFYVRTNSDSLVREVIDTGANGEFNKNCKRIEELLPNKKYHYEMFADSAKEATPIVSSTPTQTSVQTISNADELKKFKDLLDAGIITQEEFDAKKKQLLGL